MDTPPRRRGERLWMAAVWLFLAGWLLGVALYKAPSYARLYESVGQELPAPTRAVLQASAFVAQWWFVVAALLAVPLVFVARGAFDGRSGAFTVVAILGLFVVVAFSSIYLFVPIERVRDRIEKPVAPESP